MKGWISINNRIKELRKRLDKTQEAFADDLGISRPNVSNLESGNVKPTKQIIKAICAIYEVNEDWLISGNGGMFKKEYLKNDFDFLVGKLSLENDSFKKKFIEELLRLPENEWSNIENFIKKIID